MLPVAPNAVDFQGFTRLRALAANDDPAALGEAAVQFEALVIGMMLETARSASLGSGLFDGGETEEYLKLMDRQVALELARAGGFGFARMIEQQLGAGASVSPPVSRPAPLPVAVPAAPRAPAVPAVSGPSRFATPQQFVERFLPEATAAGRVLGVDPRVLLAQAALETGWGKAIPAYPDGRPAHNLFGIKADPSWQGPRIARWTIEHAAGVAERRREDFRAYPDGAASFADYVRLISGSARYAPALDAADPEGYVRAVADAGYATDPDYAAKWLAVYRSEPLRSLELKNGALEPTR